MEKKLSLAKQSESEVEEVEEKVINNIKHWYQLYCFKGIDSRDPHFHRIGAVIGTAQIALIAGASLVSGEPGKAIQHATAGAIAATISAFFQRRTVDNSPPLAPLPGRLDEEETEMFGK